MTMYTDPDGRHAFEFCRFEQQEDGLALLQWFASVDDLQNAVNAIGRYRSAFVNLHARIYLELGIEMTVGTGPVRERRFGVASASAINTASQTDDGSRT
jgi:hypothetical protein